MRCEIIKTFYKRVGSVSFTSLDIIFFDDLIGLDGPANGEGDNIFFFRPHK